MLVRLCPLRFRVIIRVGQAQQHGAQVPCRQGLCPAPFSSLGRCRHSPPAQQPAVQAPCMQVLVAYDCAVRCCTHETAEVLAARRAGGTLHSDCLACSCCGCTSLAGPAANAAALRRTACCTSSDEHAPLIGVEVKQFVESVAVA